MNEGDLISTLEVGDSISTIESLEEDKRFGSGSPLKTIISLSIGPALLKMMIGLQDILNLAFVNKSKLGIDRGAVISLASTIRQLVYGLNLVTHGGCTIKISQLVAEKRHQEAAQLYSDFIRLSLISAIITPIITIPAVKPVLKIIGLEERLLNDAFWYLLPIICSAFFISLFHLNIVTLVGIAKPNLAALLQFLNVLLSLGFDSLSIFVFKGPSWSQGITFYSGQIIISIITTILFFNGKYSIKPSLKMLVSKLSSEFGSVLKLSIPQVSILIFGSIPSFVFMGCISKTAKNTKYGSIIPPLFAAALKPGALIETIILGANMGLESSGSWAFNRRDFPRLRNLILCSLIIPLIIYIPVVTILIAEPEMILKLLVDVKHYKRAINIIVGRLYYAKILEPFSEVIQCTLLLTKHYIRATVPLMLGYISLLVGAITLAHIYPNRPNFVCYARICNDIGKFIFIIIISIKPLWEIMSSKPTRESLTSSELTTALI